ncbi:site-specific integrase [Pseudonocardia sp. RS11V-5]|uniref:tyrosine-type recombinase/integrase n=1 Tax=Pseudonocardia terrae TaxID=2905831 RepID=UPI001E5A4861|nr:site-specific integrase [Pseudonocardia terrae]MCE3555135.1 site-specific integrase [Pseudonocardia terrae]
MGSLARRPDGRWRARYRDPDGRERAKHFSRKADGERFLAMIESSKLRGTYVDPSDRTTVAEYARRWASVRPYRPSTARRIDSQIRLHVENTFLGSRRMASVLPSDVQAWVTQLAAQLAPSTVELTVNMLKAIFAAAVLDRVVGSSPVVRLALPKADKDRVVPLTVDQVLELAETVPARTRAMVLTQAGLGLRLGELLALRQQDVNFLGRTARVEHQLEDRTRARVDPKTPRSRRSVPLPQFVADALARHMQQWPPLEDGSLFYGHNRRPYHHAFYGVRTFKVAVKKLAGEEGSTFPPSTTTHDLRHHYASVLLAGGESVVAVAERLGHDDASMVLKVYGHLMPESEDRTRKIIDAAWSATSTEVTSVALGDPLTDSARTERGQSS